MSPAQIAKLDQVIRLHVGFLPLPQKVGNLPLLEWLRSLLNDRRPAPASLAALAALINCEPEGLTIHAIAATLIGRLGQA
ncbi:hypothetical protein XI06_22855 [Bradyrhizobium sp. CCBAU 11434]|uniref:hypothetical protein n=1 Tax=Bradyrhizobium sp. CCBAU 11434 TaxID=1630885 RepID=UPI0023069C3F|nr:hypothetical protein [Bradyrhizobium sp. CCBAU 11434]MDA9523039.1 hypothetical protein [Bradyrhizobium sp. CCBAU 11434]